MHRIHRRIALKSLALLGGLGFPSSLWASRAMTNSLDLNKPLNQTGWEIFQSLGKGNQFLSPTSIGLALAMTERGARESTRQEMRKVLHLGAADSSQDPGWAALVGALTAEKPGRQIQLANRLFGQKDYGFLPEFTKELASWFQAPLEELDFQANPEACRKRINDWVAEQTRKMIKDLIPSGALHDKTRLVLANAIHFKGEWLTPFSKNSTGPAPFETAKGQSKTIDRMRLKRSFVVRENEDAMVLEMPCKGQDRSVHFLLPKVRHGLKDVESKLDSTTLNELLFALKLPEMVGIGVPRFKLESTMTLNGPLSQLGMPTAFTNSANFSGMNGGKEMLKIDVILHKAVLIVDELGAEAAAATAILMAPTSMPARPPREFIIDQPFLVAITDKATRSVLFLGRVNDPGKI